MAREGGLKGSGWRSGLIAAAPLFPGLVSVGVLYGVTATAAGMPPWSTVATSLLVATGTAQFMAVELLGNGTAWWLIVLTGLLVNVRYAVYSLHLGGFVRSLSTARRWLFFAFTSDEGYAMTTPMLDGDRAGCAGQLRWSAGVMFVIWAGWQVGTVLGVTVVGELSGGAAMQMAVPVTLLTVLVLITLSPRHAVVALTAGVTALLLRDAPLNLGFVTGIAVGVATGLLLSAWPRRDQHGAESPA